MSAGIQHKLLELLYEKWYTNYITGSSINDLIQLSNCAQNEVNQALEILDSQALVQRNRLGWYIITVYGMDYYEITLSPSAVSKKKQERKTVLEALVKLYNQDTHQWMESETLMSLIHFDNLYYLLGVVVYLERKGFASLQQFSGGTFLIRLTALGFQTLQDVTSDAAFVMSSSYRILFNLENRLRHFIELKMRSRYGSDWWNGHVSDGIRRKVDDMRKDELLIGWQISESNNNLQYLHFDHLEKIITTNWTGVFEPVFQNQQKIFLRLKELEGIRNSVAHMRLLSQDGINRLEQYSQDLLNMMNISTSTS